MTSPAHVTEGERLCRAAAEYRLQLLLERAVAGRRLDQLAADTIKVGTLLARWDHQLHQLAATVDEEMAA